MSFVLYACLSASAHFCERVVCSATATTWEIFSRPLQCLGEYLENKIQNNVFFRGGWDAAVYACMFKHAQDKFVNNSLKILSTEMAEKLLFFKWTLQLIFGQAEFCCDPNSYTRTVNKITVFYLTREGCRNSLCPRAWITRLITWWLMKRVETLAVFLLLPEKPARLSPSGPSETTTI